MGRQVSRYLAMGGRSAVATGLCGFQRLLLLFLISGFSLSSSFCRVYLDGTYALAVVMYSSSSFRT